MKKVLLPLLTTLLLAGCFAKDTMSSDVADQLKNPLFAERYHEDVMQHMVDLVISNDPLTKDPETMRVIDELRNSSLQKAQEANARQAGGAIGIIVSDYSYTGGEMLLLENTLYVSPDFFVTPGPALRAYLTTVNDPRDAAFPDETAVDLGPVKNMYGAHAYEVPQSDAETQPEYITAVLWDETFKRVYGFVQLRKR